MNTPDAEPGPDRATIHVDIGADVSDDELSMLLEHLSEIVFSHGFDAGVWMHAQGDCANDDHCWGPGSPQRRAVQAEAMSALADELSPGNGYVLMQDAHSKSHVCANAVRYIRQAADRLDGAV